MEKRGTAVPSLEEGIGYKQQYPYIEVGETGTI